MRLFHSSDRLTRGLALSLAMFSLVLTLALMGTWYWLGQLTLTLPLPENPVQKAKESGPVSPLLVEYKLDLPGRGEPPRVPGDRVCTPPAAARPDHSLLPSAPGFPARAAST